MCLHVKIHVKTHFFAWPAKLTQGVTRDSAWPESGGGPGGSVKVAAAGGRGMPVTQDSDSWCHWHESLAGH